MNFKNADVAEYLYALYDGHRYSVTFIAASSLLREHQLVR